MNAQRPLPAYSDAERQLASLPIAVVLLDPEMRIATVNPAAEQFFGQSARRLRGRLLSDCLEFELATIGDHLRDSDTPVSSREIAVTVAGRGPCNIDFTASPLADIAGWRLLTLHDNTAVEALGVDLSEGGEAVVRGPEILAHEIKNPLAGIKGAAQLLARKVDKADLALTELIESEVNRIATLIEQMQQLSGKTPARLEACNPHESIRRAIAILDAAEDAGKAGIAEEFDPSLPPVLGNRDALVQVLINLLSNAREACLDVKSPQIVVRTRFASGLQLHSDKEGEPVRLSTEIRVTDNGPGIPAEMREHIFEPFVTTKKSGQGLGLALVRKLVRDMNGRIGHERDETKGLTHFRIQLPQATPGEAAGKEVAGS